MKRIFVFLAIIPLFFTAMSQSGSPSIEVWETNVASGNDKVDEYEISWTIGQLIGNVEGKEYSLVSPVNSSVLLDVTEDLTKQLMAVKLYPNPANEQVTVDFKKMMQNVTIVICNINGEVVLEKEYSGNSIDISTSTLSNGLYFIKAIHGAKEVAIKKVVIQH